MIELRSVHQAVHLQVCSWSGFDCRFHPYLGGADIVNSTCRRVFGGLHQLIQSRHLIRTSTRQHLINSLIITSFDYCCLVCGDLSGTRAAQLDRAMKACVRFIFDVPRRARISPYYASLGWFRASSRRFYILGKFIFCVFSSLQPAYILEMFTLRSSIHNRSLRGDGNLIRIPAHRSELASRSFVACSARLWNSLPFHLRWSPSQSTFDRLLRAHLLGGGGGAGCWGPRL